MKKQYSLHVEFMITELFPANGWYNIYHATISGNADVYGSRIPAIWLRYDDGNTFIHTSSAVNGSLQHTYDTQPGPIQFNKWISLNVSQTKVGNDYQYKVELNEEVLHMVKNTQPQEFEDVKIYISEPWDPAFPGYVRSVIIKGKV